MRARARITVLNTLAVTDPSFTRAGVITAAGARRVSRAFPGSRSILDIRDTLRVVIAETGDRDGDTPEGSLRC